MGADMFMAEQIRDEALARSLPAVVAKQKATIARLRRALRGLCVAYAVSVTKRGTVLYSVEPRTVGAWGRALAALKADNG